jgi:hypothetical protein
MVVGPVMDFGGIDPIHGLYLAAILNGLAAPPLILLMMLLGNIDGRWGVGAPVGCRTPSRTGARHDGLAPIAYLLF